MTITTTPPPVRRGAKPAGGNTAGGNTAGGNAEASAPVKERPARRTEPPRAPAPARKSPSKAPTRAPTKKAPGKAPARGAVPQAPRMPFAMLVIGLLGGALISLLMLRTVLAEDAFQLTKLQQNNRLLAQHEETLSQEVARAESPAEIARKARERGMRPAPGGFVNEATGQVRGGPTTSIRPVTPGGGAVGGTDPRIAAGTGRSTAGEGDGTTGTRNGTTNGDTGDRTTGDTSDGGTSDDAASDDGAIAGGGGR